MKAMKKLAAVALGLTLTTVSSLSAYAANSYTWSFAATPKYSEVPRTTSLDYSSNGYTAKTTSKSGDSATNRVEIQGNAYGTSNGAYGVIADITEANIAYDIAKPKFQRATVTFKLTLRWQAGKTANNRGTIARK